MKCIRTEVIYGNGHERSVSIYECANCGNEWDGNAQCGCHLDDEEEVEEFDPPLKRTKVLNLEVAEKRINDILDKLSPVEAEELSSKIAIARKRSE